MNTKLPPGTLYVVATPIGNLDDITRRALQVLGQVDLVVAEDTRRTRRLLAALGLERPLLSLHEHNENQRIEPLLERLREGQSLALVSDAGTPLISDPGYPLVHECRLQGISVVPVPGVSAMIAALSVSGLPTDRFLFCGFPPRTAARRREFFKDLQQQTATLVFYESAHRILDSLQDAMQSFGYDRPACLARELTKLYETVKTAQLVDLVDFVGSDTDQQKGEYVVIVQGIEKYLAESGQPIDSEDLLRELLQVMPVKQASSIVARLSGQKKNQLYQRALQMKQ